MPDDGAVNGRRRRRTRAPLTLGAVAICYLAPTLLPLASRAGHELYHVFGGRADFNRPTGPQRNPGNGDHEHDGTLHSHSAVVDGLLAVSRDADAEVTEHTSPELGGTQLSAHVPAPKPVRHPACPARAFTHGDIAPAPRAGARSPPLPPPRA